MEPALNFQRNISDGFEATSIYSHPVDDLYRKTVYKPKIHPTNSEFNFKEMADDLMKWALDHKVNHYTFFAYPHNNAITEKQDSFLDFRFTYTDHLKALPKLALDPETILRSEGDGSSFPSGGLRVTHTARAYNVWDTRSEIFIRRRNRLLYIPSLLLTHHGEALDDKTLYRKCEKILKESAMNLLRTLGEKPRDIVIALGLEQEFFVVPKSAYMKRKDLQYAGRALIG